MVDPGGASATIAEVTFTAGIDDYVLSGALPAHFRIADAYADGATVTVAVDNNVQLEVVTGVFNAVDGTISRDTVLFPTSATKIRWPTTGQRTIRPLANGVGNFTICTDTPVDGQVLVWQGATNKWCPDQRVIGPSGASFDSGATVTIMAGDADQADGGAVNITSGSSAYGPAGQVNITGGTSGSSGGAGQITIHAGDNFNGTGSDLVLESGDGLDLGGAVVVNAGDGGQGGYFQLTTGAGSNGSGGNIVLDCGASTSGADGASCHIFAGDTIDGFTGGEMVIAAGNTSVSSGGTGGPVHIAGGLGGADGSGGSVEIHGAAGSFGGAVVLGAGDSSTGDGGDIELHLGSGSGRVGVLAIFPNTGSAPSAPATTGLYYIYVDPADSKLKARGSSGTVTTLAVP